uniref:Uncharacterized protein n=1 Tax=Pristionchus pacificus TaxID=54126 RepID=A0A2A6BMZ5_PRIPA|eukprot:PDM67290.1 hypothetical protein PRIPAC_48707 [Pristionchus pacificus]
MEGRGNKTRGNETKPERRSCVSPAASLAATAAAAAAALSNLHRFVSDSQSSPMSSAICKSPIILKNSIEQHSESQPTPGTDNSSAQLTVPINAAPVLFASSGKQLSSVSIQPRCIGPSLERRHLMIGYMISQ